MSGELDTLAYMPLSPENLHTQFNSLNVNLKKYGSAHKLLIQHITH